MLYSLFFIIALACMLFLMFMHVNIILNFFITFLVLMICNIIIGTIINHMEMNALDWDCDPEKYLKMMDKREKRFRKKPRVISLLTINRAAGYMVLGDIKKAKEYLDEVDTSYLSEKNNSFLVYTINLILCYYELGEIEKAEELYETKMVQLCPIGKRHKIAVDILIGERYYYLKNYELSYKHLKKLLNNDLNKRQYLGILFRLAQMDVINGDTKKAIERFKKIVKLGNKLSIVKASEEILKTLEYSDIEA